ncbi:hypothetical protein ZWY2020_026597 [Hordeum vulgare]|nr:hypothetical protein ZWY2020_026597 [Hordeum vulgare]
MRPRQAATPRIARPSRGGRRPRCRQTTRGFGLGDACRRRREETRGRREGKVCCHGIKEDVGNGVEKAEAEATVVDKLGQVETVRHVLDGKSSEHLVVADEDDAQSLERGGRDGVIGEAVPQDTLASEQNTAERASRKEEQGDRAPATPSSFHFRRRRLSATDSPVPQTEEHIFLAPQVGVPSLVDEPYSVIYNLGRTLEILQVPWL